MQYLFSFSDILHTKTTIKFGIYIVTSCVSAVNKHETVSMWSPATRLHGVKTQITTMWVQKTYFKKLCLGLEYTFPLHHIWWQWLTKILQQWPIFWRLLFCVALWADPVLVGSLLYWRWMPLKLWCYICVSFCPLSISFLDLLSLLHIQKIWYHDLKSAVLMPSYMHVLA